MDALRSQFLMMLQASERPPARASRNPWRVRKVLDELARLGSKLDMAYTRAQTDDERWFLRRLADQIHVWQRSGEAVATGYEDPRKRRRVRKRAGLFLVCLLMPGFVWAQTPCDDLAPGGVVLDPTTIYANLPNHADPSIVTNYEVAYFSQSTGALLQGPSTMPMGAFVLVSGTCYRANLPMPVPIEGQTEALVAALRANGPAGLSAWSTPSNPFGASAPAQPVDCVVSAWSAWTPTSAWSTCVDGLQYQSEQRTRTIVQQPVNGGNPCPPLTESRTVSQTCTVFDTTAPVVAIASIAQQGKSANYTVTVTASDNVGVVRVEFSVNGVRLATLTSPTSGTDTYAAKVTIKTSGTHQIDVQAFDVVGNIGSAIGTVVR